MSAWNPKDSHHESAHRPPRSIDQYLAALREALAGEDPALIQDALYDAEEYLRAELPAHPDRSESDTLELIASTYGAPDEVAAAYRTTEQKLQTALAPPLRQPARSSLGRFFAVYTDTRAWTALFYMLLSLVTGIFYFTTVVTGLSLTAGLAILIIGIPFFLLFVGFTRVLSLAEGRLVEGLLGQRMPRRPLYPARGVPILTRIRDMLADRRTWTTMFYFLLMLPLGVLYFAVAVTGYVTSLGLVFGGVFGLLSGTGVVHLDELIWDVPAAPAMLLAIAVGVVLLTVMMHLTRGIGRMHGTLAKNLLVARAGSD
ncbi:MAG: hypothetical protein FJ191_03110 [Gammaproteobacteria bacterium]|nr:hypothetical protein [Gammaproteobacteria bacterium]